MAEEQGKYDLPCDALVLAPGHSARDTFQMLREAGAAMEQKPFAIGVRIEHPQARISQAQFGESWGKAAPCGLQIGLTSAQRPVCLYLLRLPRGPDCGGCFGTGGNRDQRHEQPGSGW